MDVFYKIRVTKSTKIRTPRLVLAGKIIALTRGHAYVSVDDIRAVALPALRHRLLLNFEGEANEISTDTIVEELLTGIAP